MRQIVSPSVGAILLRGGGCGQRQSGRNEAICRLETFAFASRGQRGTKAAIRKRRGRLMRIVAAVLFSIVVPGGGVALAQSEPTTRVRPRAAARESRRSHRARPADRGASVRGRGGTASAPTTCSTRSIPTTNWTFPAARKAGLARVYRSRSAARGSSMTCRRTRRASTWQPWRGGVQRSCSTQDCMFSDYSSVAISAAQGERRRALASATRWR